MKKSKPLSPSQSEAPYLCCFSSKEIVDEFQSLFDEHQDLYQCRLNIPMIEEIVTATERVFRYALKRHSKLFLIRLVIRFPLDNKNHSSLISEFLRLFIRKEKQAKYDPYYCVVRESDYDDGIHYHMVLFLNGHKVKTPFIHLRNAYEVMDKLLGEGAGTQCIYLCKNQFPNPHSYYLVHRSDAASIAEARRALSYLAKEKSKDNVPGKRYFTSQIPAEYQPLKYNVIGSLKPDKQYVALLTRVATLINNYVLHHTRIVIAELHLMLPPNMLTRTALVSEFNRRLMMYLNSGHHDPAYFTVRLEDRYYTILLLDGDTVGLNSYSYLLTANKILNTLLGLPPSYACDYLNPSTAFAHYYYINNDYPNGDDYAHMIGENIYRMLQQSRPVGRRYFSSRIK